MAKRKKGRVPPHLRKYLFKKKGRGGKKQRRASKRKARRAHPMAKKRRSHRRRSHRRTHHRRRRSGGGGTRSWVPPREDLHLFAAGAGIGYLESQAAASADHVLNKIPRPIAQLGYTGGTALAAWVIAKLTGNKWARLIARSSATIAAYQIGRHGGLYADSSKAVTISGDDNYMGDDDYLGHEEMIDDATMGALTAEGEQGDDMSGVDYDDAVQRALEHA